MEYEGSSRSMGLEEKIKSNVKNSENRAILLEIRHTIFKINIDIRQSHEELKELLQSSERYDFVAINKLIDKINEFNDIRADLVGLFIKQHTLLMNEK